MTLQKWSGSRVLWTVLTALFSGYLNIVMASDEVADPTKPLEPVRLQLKWLHQFQFAGYYAAIEQGYYEEEGLDVTLLEHPMERSPLDVLLAREADYVVMGSDLLVARAEGKPLVALAAITQHDPLALLVTKASGIDGAEDLRGKRLMLDYGAHDASILAMLKKVGLTTDDYLLQQTSYDPLDLLDGKTDAFNAYITDQGFLLDEQGVENHYIHPGRYGIDFYSDILTTTEQEIAQNPDRVARFRQASLKGWTYAMSNSEAVIDLILKKYNSQKRSRAHLQYEASQMREMVQPLLVELGYMHHERWTHIRDTFAGLGFLKGSVDIDSILYQGQMDDSRDILDRYLLPVLLLVLLLSIAVILVILWNRNLRRQVAFRTEELVESNRQIECIMQSINEGLVVVDRQQRVVRVNQKLERMVGTTHQEMIGKPLSRLFVKGNEHALFDVRRTLIGTDGDLIPVQVSVALLRSEGAEADGGYGSALLIHDLRDQARVETQEQLALFQAGVFEMTTAVLHSIGNVVTGMGGCAIRLNQNQRRVEKLTAALGRYFEESEAESDDCDTRLDRQRKILKGVWQALNRLEERLQQHEPLPRLEHGIQHVAEVIAAHLSASRPIIHPTRFSVDLMVDDVENLILDRLNKHHVKLVRQLDPALDSLFLPRNLLLQILLSLTQNSLEAIIEEVQANGQLAGGIMLQTALQSTGSFRLTVSDNGCGYDPDRLGEIFQSGYTTKQSGSGNGLYTVAAFVSSMGGEIEAESEGWHQGMRMVITLPANIDGEQTGT